MSDSFPMIHARFPVVAPLFASSLLALALFACDETVPTEVLYRAPDSGDVADTGRATDTGAAADTGLDDDAAADARDVSVLPDTTASDTGADAADEDTGGADAADTAPDPCDLDRDGYMAESCGGADCDDEDPRISPGARESCDFVDNDCDEVLNDGITCTFYAHTPDDLYEIDPFNAVAQHITSVPSLLDFDTSLDGTLWGITSSLLYRFDEAQRRWVTVGIGVGLSGVNGFAIDSRGNGFATGGNSLYAVDLESGTSRRIGDMGGSFSSSGDCVIDKNDVLYMTSRHLSTQDVLVRLDATTGEGTEIGPIGYPAVFGLTAAWGYLFGVTNEGLLLEIDPATGHGEIIARFEGRQWWGAASTAGR